MDDISRSSSGSLDADEAAMRRSLGLDRDRTLRAPAATPQGGKGAGQMQPGHTRARHRFRQDGEIQVEIGRGGVGIGAGNGAGRHAELEQLRTVVQQERAARGQAEHALHQARENLRALQTQIAHAGIAHREAIAAEQRARDAAEHALGEMQEKLAAAEAAPMQPRRRRQTVDAKSADIETKDGPQPVQWWLPGWQRRGG